METTVIQRISELIERRGLTPHSFAAEIGFNYSTLNNYLVGRRKSIDQILIGKIISSFGDVSPDWLLLGKGGMYKNVSDDSVQPTCTDSEKSNYILVPLYNYDSVGGMHSSNMVSDAAQYVESYIPFIDAQQNDICIVESGNSMVPTIPPGSVLLLREVPSWREYFGFGNVFVIELADGRRITKVVQKCADDPSHFVVCHSYNSDVQDEDLPKSLITKVWKVIKILINKGF